MMKCSSNMNWIPSTFGVIIAVTLSGALTSLASIFNFKKSDNHIQLRHHTCITSRTKMSSDSDLSDYERVRLDNIRRNNEFLAQLGLAPIKAKIVAPIKSERVERPEKVNKKSKREDDVVVPDEKRRRSGRLSGNFVKVEAVQGVTEEVDDVVNTVDETAFYDRTPHVRILMM